MPLIHSATNKARNENIRREIEAGKDPKQAAAIGYSIQRHAKKDEHEERQIEKHAHERFRYGRHSPY